MAKQVLLESIYYGDSPGALRGPKALFEEAKKQGLAKITLKDCVDYLLGQPTYTLYRPARKNYRRNRIEANLAGEVVQIDIMDMQRFKNDNDDYLYVLLCYDTFSKYLTSFPMKNRKPESVLAGLEALLQQAPFTVVTIYWDKEGSFLSRKVQSWLKGRKIHNYTTTSKVKAPGVERVIRTIRTAVQRYMESKDTGRWLEYLPRFVSHYNNRKHSTTGYRPLDLVNDPMLVVASPKDKKSFVKLPPIGSYVRLNRLRNVFEKESTGNWTSEVFRVVRHKSKATVPMLFVQDLTWRARPWCLVPRRSAANCMGPTRQEDCPRIPQADTSRALTRVPSFLDWLAFQVHRVDHPSSSNKV